MHVLEDEDDLRSVKLDELRTHTAELFEHIKQLAMLHVVHQDV